MKILGVTVDDLSIDEISAKVPSEPKLGATQFLVTLNPEYLVLANKNADLRRYLETATLRTVDGFGMVLSGLLHGHFWHRLTGVDLVSKICLRAPSKNWRIFLLGGGSGVAQSLAQHLRETTPGLQIDAHSGSKNITSESPSERQLILRQINDLKPHFLFVAYGTPKQEKWIVENLSELQVGVVAGVGGAFDLLTGLVPRAPHPMSLLGLEWLWRLLVEPRLRLHRIINAVLVFPTLVLRERLGL